MKYPIKNSRVELRIPHNGKKIGFAYSEDCLDTYENVGRQILRSNRFTPNGDVTASLLYAVYCDQQASEELEFKEIRNQMRVHGLWVYNRNLWTKEGVYVILDSRVKGISKFLNPNQLEEVLEGGQEINSVRFSKDGAAVRFAPRETYKLGEQTPESLAKDGFIIASCGIEGAEKLGEVAKKFSEPPVVKGSEVDGCQEPKQKVTFLFVNPFKDYKNRYAAFRNNLCFSGNLWGIEGVSSAFGLIK